MARRKECYEPARAMYVVQGLPLSEIAKRLGLTARTLRYWRKDGEWVEQRRLHVSKVAKLYEDAFDTGTELLKRMRIESESGRLPRPQLISEARRFLETVKSMTPPSNV